MLFIEVPRSADTSSSSKTNLPKMAAKELTRHSAIYLNSYSVVLAKIISIVNIKSNTKNCLKHHK